jgi:hypothetical protein
MPALATLIIAIANINVWNRLNVTTGQVAGEWVPACVPRLPAHARLSRAAGRSRQAVHEFPVA